jgi:hypothetical protein
MIKMATRRRSLLLPDLLLAGAFLAFNPVAGNAPTSEAHASSPEPGAVRATMTAPLVEPCRGPEFPGCGACCRENAAQHTCIILSSSDGDAEPGFIPWYNNTEFRDGDCPADCRPCASCLSRDEREYAKLGSRPECRCESLEIGIDPCFAPSSCECYCQRKLRILRACPHLSAEGS